MSSFSVVVDVSIGYNGEKPLPIGENTVLLPCAGGGLTNVSIEDGVADWWTPSDGSRQLSSAACHPSGQTIAVAERRMKAAIHIVSPQTRRILQSVKDVAKLQIIDMAYSRDGSRFVALADAPAHTFTIFQVVPDKEFLQTPPLRKSEFAAAVPYPGISSSSASSFAPGTAAAEHHHYTNISFNPRSSSDICTSGGGHLTFWKHEEKSTAHPLLPLHGLVARNVPRSKNSIRVTCHEWSIIPGGTVAAGTNSGMLLSFNLTTGVGDLAFDFADEDIQETPCSTSTQIVGIVVTKHHTIVLTEDGVLRFLTCLQQVQIQQLQQQQHGGGANLSMSMTQASLGQTSTGNFASANPAASGVISSSASFPTAASQGGSASMAASLVGGNVNASTQQQIQMIAGSPPTYTLQRVITMPLMKPPRFGGRATTLTMMPDWKTLLVGSRADGTLAAITIPQYDTLDIDVSSFAYSSLGYRVVTSGIRGPVVGGVFLPPASENSPLLGAVLDSSSILRLFDVEHRREEFRVHAGEKPSCIVSSNVVPIVMVGSETGTIRCYKCTQNENQQQQQQQGEGEGEGAEGDDESPTLRLLLSDKVSSSGVRLIVPHPTLPLAVAVAGTSTLVFLPLSDPVRVFGVAELPSSYEGIAALSWTHDEANPCFVFTSNNSTVFLARYPQDPTMSETLCYPIEEIVLNSWRTELPMTTVAVGMSSDASVLCFGGAVDKETKFFHLDRNASPERKDRDSKPLKTPLSFRDHEKPLVSLQIVGNNTKLLSAGSDGRVVIRDVACLLTAAPNVRDIRRDALAVAPKHVSLLGGVRSVAVSQNSRKMMTAGWDGVALLWSMGPANEVHANMNSAAQERRNHLLVTPESNFWINQPSPLQQQQQQQQLQSELSLNVNNNNGLVSTDEEFPFPSATQPAEEETLDFRDKRRKLALDFDRQLAQGEHEKIRNSVSKLQTRLREVYLENERAAEDEQVELLDFIVNDERKEFDSVCSKKISEMKHNVRIDDLRCDYTAEYIKKTKWDTMKAQLNVLEGLEMNPEEPVKVYNFAIPNDNQHDLDILRKVKFMRRMQERMKFVTVQKVNQANRQQQQQQGDGESSLVGGPGGQFGQSEGIVSTAGGALGTARSANNEGTIGGGGGGGEGSGTVSGSAGDEQQGEGENNNNNESNNNNDGPVPTILSSQNMEAVSDNLSDVTPFLFPSRDCFAKVRAMMQSKLLLAKIHALRVDFNEKFNSLVNDKKNIITQSSERTTKCRVIQLQLGQKERSLVECKVSDIENPEIVLKVDDDDVQEDRSHDPAFKRQKQKEAEEAERWRRVHGNDDGPERALKLWMDGRLDKEINEIVAEMDPPDFADEKSSKYVPQDDWTDDQQKIYREFEKKYEKLRETVAEQRRLLGKNLDEMQKSTGDAIARFDSAVKALFYERVRISQFCAESELARIKLAFNFLEYAQTEAELQVKEQHHLELQNKLITASTTTDQFKKRLESKKAEMQALKTEEQNKEKALKQQRPFADSDDLCRWWTNLQQKKKRGAAGRAGGQGGGVVGKGFAAYGVDVRKQAKAAAAAAKAESMARFDERPILPDPWEFLEREDFEKYELKRQEEAVHQATGAVFMFPDAMKPDTVNEHVWEEFLMYVDERAMKERKIKELQGEIAELTTEDGRLTAIEDELRAMSDDARQQRDMKQRAALERLFDVDQLLVFRQGHVEYEQDPFITEYDDAVLIATDRVNDLNGDIRARGTNKIALMNKEKDEGKLLRQIEWETKHAEYQTKILELECRQLQTLKVTKQMQEFISGGGEDHNERQRAKLREKIDHVRKTMVQRIEDKKFQMGKVKKHTRERELENTMLVDQVGHADSLLATRRHVHNLHAVDGDAQLPQRLMRDMRITRRLEDVARAQNEEMAALKKEVDRLRERTFPSFAVVSKRVIGSANAPDAL